jgi:hypothetical protein
MPEKIYESEKVPIPWSKRRQEAVPGVICALIGLALFGISGSMDPDAKGFVVIWGSVLGGVGVFYLIYAVSKTHTTTLTARGLAEKAADEAEAERRRASQNAALNSCLGTIGLLACIIGLAIYCYGPLSDQLNSRITVYPISCSNWSTTATDKCLSGEQVMAETTYTVRVDQQLVVGINADAKDPLKLYNCVVADSQNWSCAASPAPGSMMLKMHDGKFSFDPVESGLESYHFTSRFRYFVEKFTN